MFDFRFLTALGMIAACSLCSPATAKSEIYMRMGTGVAKGADANLHDVDCGANAPPALFGCGTGIDGAPLGARLDTASSAVVDLGIGARLAPGLRGEFLLGWSGKRKFRGNSNFLRSGQEQPVTGTVESLAMLGALYWDLPKAGPIRPFMGGGLGISRNRVSTISFKFPVLGPTAVTAVPSGNNSDLTYMLTAGGALPVSDKLSIELAYRYADLGSLKTSAGDAVVVRRSGSRTIAISGTRARMQTHGALLSLRYTF